MPSTLRFDARGRITIPKAIRKGMGKDFVAIRMPDGIVLHPVLKHLDLPVDAAGVSGEDAARREAGLE